MPYTIINRGEPPTTTKLTLGQKKMHSTSSILSFWLWIRATRFRWKWYILVLSFFKFIRAFLPRCHRTLAIFSPASWNWPCTFVPNLPGMYAYSMFKGPAFVLRDFKFLHFLTVDFGFCCRCQSWCTTIVRHIKVKACPKKESELLQSPCPVSFNKNPDHLIYPRPFFCRHIAIEWNEVLDTPPYHVWKLDSTEHDVLVRHSYIQYSKRWYITKRW